MVVRHVATADRSTPLRIEVAELHPGSRLRGALEASEGGVVFWNCTANLLLSLVASHRYNRPTCVGDTQLAELCAEIDRDCVDLPSEPSLRGDGVFRACEHVADAIGAWGGLRAYMAGVLTGASCHALCCSASFFHLHFVCPPYATTERRFVSGVVESAIGLVLGDDARELSEADARLLQSDELVRRVDEARERNPFWFVCHPPRARGVRALDLAERVEASDDQWCRRLRECALRTIRGVPNLHAMFSIASAASREQLTLAHCMRKRGMRIVEWSHASPGPPVVFPELFRMRPHSEYRSASPSIYVQLVE